MWIYGQRTHSPALFTGTIRGKCFDTFDVLYIPIPTTGILQLAGYCGSVPWCIIWVCLTRLVRWVRYNCTGGKNLLYARNILLYARRVFPRRIFRMLNPFGCTCSTPWYLMSRLMFCYICTIWATSRRDGHSLKKYGSHRWSLETGNPSPGVGEWRLYILTTFLACFRYISYEHNNIVTGRSFYRFTRHDPEGFSLEYILLLSTAATNCMQCYYTYDVLYEYVISYIYCSGSINTAAENFNNADRNTSHGYTARI